MQLYILDTDPVKSAQLIPDKYKFKMLIELGQLICSAGLSDVYKPIAQGKELQQWVTINKAWILQYFISLYEWSLINIKVKNSTKDKLFKISNDLWYTLVTNKRHSLKFLKYITAIPTHAYFRYASAYECPIPSKTLLPIEVCIEAYKEYLQWKMKG